MSEPRVVIVGAGMGGLCSAIVLAHQGLDVTVVESSDAPGGKVHSREVDGVVELRFAGRSHTGVRRAGDVAGRDEVPQGLARAVAHRTGVEKGARGVVDQPAAPRVGVGEDLPCDGGRHPSVSGHVPRLIGEVERGGRVDDDGRLLAGPAAGCAGG